MLKSRWFGIVAYSVLGIIFLVGVIITVRQYVYFGEPYTPPPSPTIAPTPAPTEQTAQNEPAEPTTEPTPAPTTEPTPAPLQDLADPVKIYFTRQEMSADIIGLPMIREENTIRPADADDHLTAAWNSDGPVPGEPGIAHINGHISKDQVLGTFHVLRDDMVEGDEVAIEYADGSVLYFEVEVVMTYSLEEFPSQILYPIFEGDPLLSLVTCAGDYDRSIGTSQSRVLAMARLKQ